MTTVTKILFLGYDIPHIRQAYLDRGCSVEHLDENAEISSGHIYDKDIIISYGYRRIITQEHVRIAPVAKCRMLNCHISYLPFNRGSHPSYHAAMDGTPQGVTIHEIDEGVDTGPIIWRELGREFEDDTFAALYERLQDVAAMMLKCHADDIILGKYTAVPQPAKLPYNNYSEIGQSIYKSNEKIETYRRKHAATV